MKKILLTLILLVNTGFLIAQTNPAITEWLQNTTLTGSYYASGNSTAIDNSILANCQEVCYSNDFVYVTTTGVPAYATGPFLDGNPSQATNQNAIFKFPLNPIQNTGTPTATTPGNIGVFINGVALYDYRDGVAWNPNTNNICGGPGNAGCPGGPGTVSDWNRDAIPAEQDGFDCSKGHPGMGNYHHHQNPSAFKYDLNVLSNVCNTYDAEGLYIIDPAQHSPLIGFAYDGFPIYGAYGYKNADGTGGIDRIKSGYQLRNITTRTTLADGTSVSSGPAVSTTYFLGYFKEDYEFISNAADDYLDEHNGRFCVTPEYPAGTYAYFATVNTDWNSSYPYVVGPTFYGVYANRSVNSITEACTIYTPSTPFALNFQPKIMLEGCYNGSGAMTTDITALIPLTQPYSLAPYLYAGTESLTAIPSNMVDWVLVEARTGTPSISGVRTTVTAETRAAILLSDGNIVGTDGNPVVFENLTDGQSYYFCIRHRNHLDVLTSTALVASQNLVYDFTTAIAQALGSNQLKQHSDGTAMLYAGDFNQEGTIQITDFDDWAIAPAILFLYKETDANLDGIVQTTDYDQWYINQSKLGIAELAY